MSQGGRYAILKYDGQHETPGNPRPIPPASLEGRNQPIITTHHSKNQADNRQRGRYKNRHNAASHGFFFRELESWYAVVTVEVTQGWLGPEVARWISRNVVTSCAMPSTILRFPVCVRTNFLSLLSTYADPFLVKR